MHHFTPLHSSRRVSASMRIVLAALVCLTLLQTPIPISHQHDDFDSSVELAAHVQFRHQDQVHAQCDSHWHLVLPRDLGADEDSPRPDSPPVDVALASFSGASIDATDSEWAFFDSYDPASLSASSHLSLVRQIALVGRLKEKHHPVPFAVTSSVRTRAILCVIQA